MTVLEIGSSIEPTPELIHACGKLKQNGFRLALDDFIWKPDMKPLADLTDYVKIDFSSNREPRAGLLKELRDCTAALIATKVENSEKYQQARDKGFNFFQGSYFCKPIVAPKFRIPKNMRLQIELLHTLQKPDLDTIELTEIVKCDESLRSRLLRFANSPVFALPVEITSIQAALFFLGEIAFRRIATVAIANDLNQGQSTEVLRTALVRARFCELAAGSCCLNSKEQYLLGMFSLLPAMLRAPAEQVLAALPLRSEIYSCLTGGENAESVLLCWQKANELAEWGVCEEIEAAQVLDRDKLHKAYSNAVVWADATIHAGNPQ